MVKKQAKLKTKIVKPSGKLDVLGWFNDKFEMVDKAKATFVKVRYPNGTVVFGIINKT